MNTATRLAALPLPAPAGSRFERNRPRALELFAERGFAQVSLRELARHLELTAGSIYNHCASKEELLLEFIEEHYMALLGLFGRRPRQASPATTLNDIARELLALYASQPAYFHLALRDAIFLGAEQRQQVNQLRQRLGQKLDALLLAAGFANPGHHGVPALELFEHLPLWLASLDLNESQRHGALLRALTAPLHPRQEIGP
ncbi:TetR/AcrR family transcriptional regulator [Pseudomonas japonica]|uniref:TetR/AcrR family transcriptional regulator n=1 Tax=Pseudomonas TaxID=286 RepID=UPI0029276532|nr:helix-turn-helix domain-containing protein [Pseudomonas sp. zfem002]MDU9390027.1 helix-turn-helix domain-containing protein [Pseudomonas sp. zfem002]